ncbi:MAG TPA: hypothetical protein PL105_07590 [Caldilineaceae bacterium]|nr:hypothetical protein [Caldilineaceae bacterium]
MTTTPILTKLRCEHEEDAGSAWPESHLKELLLMYDICIAEEQSAQEIKTVLGEPAYDFVNRFLDYPI